MSGYQKLTMKDIDDYVKLVINAENQTEYREFVGGVDSIKQLYEFMGRESFKKYIANIQIITSKEGIDYINSLGL